MDMTFHGICGQCTGAEVGCNGGDGSAFSREMGLMVKSGCGVYVMSATSNQLHAVGFFAQLHTVVICHDHGDVYYSMAQPCPMATHHHALH